MDEFFKNLQTKTLPLIVLSLSGCSLGLLLIQFNPVLLKDTKGILISFMAILFAILTAYLLSIHLMKYLQGDEVQKNKDTITPDSIKLTQEQEVRLLADMEAKLVDQTSEGLIWQLYEKTEKKLEDFSVVNIAGSVFSNTRERINEEIFALRRRGNLNLVLGILITIIGVAALTYFIIIEKQVNEKNSEFIEFFLPRLSLVLLIEVFAYFFLRLYKSSLEDIKFFQNELTNIESKLTAMQLSFEGKNEEHQFCVISSLINTERNPVQKISGKESNQSFNKDVTIELIKTIGDVVKKDFPKTT